MLLEQLILDLVRKTQFSSRFGVRLLHGPVTMVNVSSSTASDVVVLVVGTRTKGGLGDGFGVFALGGIEAWRADVACSSASPGVCACALVAYCAGSCDVAVHVPAGC